MRSALLVTNIFPPLIGGPATFIDRAATSLAGSGIAVTVVCSSMERTDPSDAARPYRVIRIPLRNRVKYELNLRRHLFFQLLRHRTVLVNGLENPVYSVARRIGRSYVLKIVGDTVWETARNQGATCLGIDEFQTDPESQKAWKSQIEVRNRYVLAASRVVTPSHYLRGVVMGWGVPAERVVVIENGVELDGPQPMPLAPDRGAGEPLRVLYVGRLSNWKGVETLLLATQGLPNVRVTIVGDGPAMPQLVAFKNQLGLGPEVEFTGRVSAAAARASMGRHHLLVLTSLYEGLSHTLLEACAAGLPCVVSGCGGNNEVIEEGRSGFLIPPQDVAALRASISRVERDEALRRDLAAGARRRADRFDLRRTVERYREELSR